MKICYLCLCSKATETESYKLETSIAVILPPITMKICYFYLCCKARYRKQTSQTVILSPYGECPLDWPNEASSYR